MPEGELAILVAHTEEYLVTLVAVHPVAGFDLDDDQRVVVAGVGDTSDRGDPASHDRDREVEGSLLPGGQPTARPARCALHTAVVETDNDRAAVGVGEPDDRIG